MILTYEDRLDIEIGATTHGQLYRITRDSEIVGFFRKLPDTSYGLELEHETCASRKFLRFLWDMLNDKLSEEWMNS